MGIYHMCVCAHARVGDEEVRPTTTMTKMRPRCGAADWYQEAPLSPPNGGGGDDAHIWRAI